MEKPENIKNTQGISLERWKDLMRITISPPMNPFFNCISLFRHIRKTMMILLINFYFTYFHNPYQVSIYIQIKIIWIRQVYPTVLKIHSLHYQTQHQLTPNLKQVKNIDVIGVTVIHVFNSSL